MPRYCLSCGTKLPGRKGHGFINRQGALVCGRKIVTRTVKNDEGSASLKELPSPMGCRM